MQINSPEVDFNIGIMDYSLYRKDTRFEVPKGLTKKEYKALQKETQDHIDSIIKRIREIGREDGMLLDMTREDYIGKKNKIKAILKPHEEFGDDVLKKAKVYPIENLIDFNSGGFAKCLWHNESRPSLKWYPERNKAHCFGCGIDVDSIDTYQKIYNTSLKETIKNLCH